MRYIYIFLVKIVKINQQSPCRMNNRSGLDPAPAKGKSWAQLLIKWLCCSNLGERTFCSSLKNAKTHGFYIHPSKMELESEKSEEKLNGWSIQKVSSPEKDSCKNVQICSVVRWCFVNTKNVALWIWIYLDMVDLYTRQRNRIWIPIF